MHINCSFPAALATRRPVETGGGVGDNYVVSCGALPSFSLHLLRGELSLVGGWVTDAGRRGAVSHL